MCLVFHSSDNSGGTWGGGDGGVYFTGSGVVRGRSSWAKWGRGHDEFWYVDNERSSVILFPTPSWLVRYDVEGHVQGGVRVRIENVVGRFFYRYQFTRRVPFYDEASPSRGL